MAETAEVPVQEEQQTQDTHRPHETTVQGNKLMDSFFSNSETVYQQPSETPTQTDLEAKPTETPAAVTTETKKEEPKVEAPVVAQEWWKDYGWESPDTAKAEITRLKETKPQEIKYENEESKKVHQLLLEGKVDDVLDIYSKQKSIDRVINAEVNKDTAAEIIKLNMQLKYPGLKPEQIEFQYKQEYGIPKEPVQKTDELDEDFSERQSAWRDQVANIQMKTEIAATMAKPELEQAKQKLVLPDITKQDVPKPPTQEELESAKKYDNAYIQSVDSSIKEFNGFSVGVKSEVVDFPVTFGITDEEKVALATRMKDFVNSNYDVNSLFAERWVNKDKTLNTSQMAKDLSLIENADKILQKVANDASTKTWETYVKTKKNIDINETTQQGTTVLTKEDKTPLDAVRDQFFG